MAKINESMKWPFNKKQYDENYLKIFGKKCKRCKGTGRSKEAGQCMADSSVYSINCPDCKGTGRENGKNKV